MKKIKGFMILIALVLTMGTISSGQRAEAASSIKVEDYIKYIVQQMKWQTDGTSEQPYIDAAMEKGILKEGDFKDYTTYLTRTDAAVIANRLDEYINQKYGYPQDVYEFLRDCTLFEGRLFYNTEGKLYPKGATRETYPEENFHEEAVMPILGEYFKNDNWKDRGLRTVYEYRRDYDGNIVRRYMEVGLIPDNKELLGTESLSKNSEILKAWNIIKDGERKVAAVLEKRISDINDIPKSKREAVASIVAKGIIKGFSNGKYVQNREFRGDNNITAKGAKDVIQLVLNPEKRALISPDGQLIRTTNLPKNAKDYPYILECFPNEFYEMKYSFMFLTDYLSGEIKRDEYAYPREINYDYLYDNFYYHQMELNMDKYEHYDTALLKVERYLQHIFNVDYRTVDDKWKEGLASSFHSYKKDWRIDLWIDNYIEGMKKNKVIVESERIAVEPSAIYDSRGFLYVRTYVKYKITAKNVNVDPGELIYDASSLIKNIKNGEWRYGYFDIVISSNSNQWGIGPFAHVSDWLFDQSFKQ